jgi:RNA polymerase sigma-70 factor (ECF subfamily)
MGHAEDLVQEVFVILWEKRGTIKSENLKSYLFTIANNLYIDHYRHKNINLNLKYDTSVNTSESPEYLLEQKEFDEKLKTAIASLSEKERTVFLMNRIDDLTFKEIAESLGISVKTIEKRMHNAVEKLFKKINHKL